MVYIKTTKRNAIKKRDIIDEIQIEANKKNQELSITTDRVSQKKTECQILLVGVSSLRLEREKLEKEVSSMRLEKLSFENEKKNFNDEHMRTIVNHSVDITKKKQEYDDIEKRVKSIVKRKEELEKEVYLLNQNKAIFDELQKDVQKLSNEKAGVISMYNARQRTCQEEEAQVQELIKKNGRILIETERNLGILDIYIKRLQGYYDHAGLNINILEQFNMQNK